MHDRLVLLFDLLQDVNILGPVARLASRRIDAPMEFMVSSRFRERDASGVWHRELEELAQATSANLAMFRTEFEAWSLLAGKRGMILSASESDLGTHSISHGVFKVAPSSFLRVTVQHGYECLGFLHNREHDRAHGRNIGFAADVLCGWADAGSLTSLSASERIKLHAAGPPLLLDPPRSGEVVQGGLICENLHSVRLKASWTFRAGFMDTFFAFCDELAARGESVWLRPHPAGQYMMQSGIALPANVSLESRPSYKLDFSAFAYGISAPSSVLVDMVLAGIPVAVWQDEEGRLDAGHYRGLPVVSDLEDWLRFHAAAKQNPDALASARRRFLEASGLKVERAEVEQRFLALLSARLPVKAPVTLVGRREVPVAELPVASKIPALEPMRLLMVANALIPTLELYFTDPLEESARRGEVVWTILTEAELKEKFGKDTRSPAAWQHMRARFDEVRPDLVVFCRYSGPHAEPLVAHAKAAGVPCLLHLDDDLLNVPMELGAKKFQFHNHPLRLATVRHLLDHCDLVFCSTPSLKRHLEGGGFRAPMHAGAFAVGMDVLRRAENHPVRRVGYMGFDHERDFQIALPGLTRYLERHPDVRFELFGAMPLPPELRAFGDRITVLEPVRPYGAFRKAFAAREWDIGIAPLADTAFNARKSDLKWMEYTSVGAAMVATAGTVYDDCGSGGCAVLVPSEDEGWFNALDDLTTAPERRFEMVRRAQERLERQYSGSLMRAQVQEAIAIALGRSDRRRAA